MSCEKDSLNVRSSHSETLPSEFLRKLKQVKDKRPKVVIDHILEHGYITTEELRDVYGYDHPPRAARDVREQGIPLDTFRVESKQGRSIGAYRFGDPTGVQEGKAGGRKAWPKSLKKNLLAAEGSRCRICTTNYNALELQVDHRVPYEVGGDPGDLSRLDNFMLLCGSCNRAKSWSCEHCSNWSDDKNPSLCRSCYWGSPENYSHIALRLIRRLDITWTDTEIPAYNRLVELSEKFQEELPTFVKRALRNLH